MNRAGNQFLTLLAVVCLAITCGCSKSALPEEEPAELDLAAAPSSLPPPLPPPPPPPPPPEPSAEVTDDSDVASDGTVEGPQDFSQPQSERPLTPQEARAAIEELGGRVSLDESDKVVKVFLNRTQIGDDQMWMLQYLPEIQVLNLTGTPLTDRGLERVHALSKLQRLYPARTEVTDQGIRNLQQALPNCTVYR